MHKPDNFAGYFGRPQSPRAQCGFYTSQNHRPPFRRRPCDQSRGEGYFSPHYRDPPTGAFHTRSNFVIQLRLDGSRTMGDAETRDVIQKLKFPPQKFDVLSGNIMAGVLFYEQWSEAMETVVQLWEMKLNGAEVHSFLPRIIYCIKLPSDKEDLDNRLRPLFVEKLKGLVEGDLVLNWMKKIQNLERDMKGVSDLLCRPQKIGICNELLRKKAGLEFEKDLIWDRVKEFKNGVKRIVGYLEDVKEEEDNVIDVFHFPDKKIAWDRIYGLMMRECRRIDDGLPIYSHRHEILKQIFSQQVTVLVGETGSGKSTQLVQFLADSGLSGYGSIICTQPRKLAALSLTERVKEESHGCYKDNSVVCYPSYSSFQEFDSKVIFMTDHCLLQHYMSDRQLARISCIVIDEAHERSLNTDLLLALIRKLLCQRPDLRLVIMSATADADQFAKYFFGCRTLQVSGRSFPVDIIYVPSESEVSNVSNSMPSYVSDVVKMVTHINNNEKDGTILAFLTSQLEVEWACDNFRASSTIILPLHGKLSHEEQRKVFLSYPGKRKVIFTTNVAETSLTIPGVKYVVDSGLAKESRYDPASGMNILRVCKVSQSAAKQRAGRAGRTEPGICYRLYTEDDFKSMLPHQEPEIRMVHLGIAVLRILALGIKNIMEFDFVDAPCTTAIDMAVRSLIQIGAITQKDIFYELSLEGREMVKLGIEPRLCKIILQCFHHRLGREGLVLAAVMSNSSSIFCRVGTEENKLKSDRLKVKFCHPNGDLFTLLAVFKEWEALPRHEKNTWCWENSINAKSMKRCQDTVADLEACLKNELNIIVPSYWLWNPLMDNEHDGTLKNIILSSLSENAAMYSGCEQIGYQVALSGKYIQLHPSCSLLNFGQRPNWVVFGEILSASNEYLVCVTVCDFKCLANLSPPPLFDFLEMESHQLQKRILLGFGSVHLKRFCGKYNGNLRNHISAIRALCEDERICVDVNVDDNQIHIYAVPRNMETVCGFVNDALEYERKLLLNECLEKCLYNGGPKVLPSFALFGSGAEIKHLELDKRFLTVDIFYSKIQSIDDKELLVFLEKFTLGSICAVSRLSGGGLDSDDMEKWGRVTFMTPDAAKMAAELNQFEFDGGLLKVMPSRNSFGVDNMLSFPAVRAKICWPRRYSKGVAIVKCDPRDVSLIVSDCSNLCIGNRLVWCQAGEKSRDSVVFTGLDRELSEADVLEVLHTATNRRIVDLFLVRGNAIDNPPPSTCEEAILREISPFMPRKNPQGHCVHVQVFPPEPRDCYMRASITFDGNLHLEAAKALEQIDGKILPGCFLWQKIRCQRLFHSSVSCPGPVYLVIKDQLESLLGRIRRRNGVECSLERNQNGSYRVKISANATKIVADLRSPLEQLMKGHILHHPDITPTVLQQLFSRDGVVIMKTVQRETRTHILFDKHNITLRIFGSAPRIDNAKQRLVRALLSLHDSKQLEVQLRDGLLPPDMMKRVVQNFGPDLHGLKEKFPEADFSLNARRHCISIIGTKEIKQEVDEIIHNLSNTSGTPSLRNIIGACPICLCEVEDTYALEGCCHKFCRMCLVEQLESAIRSHDSFPLTCTKENCGTPFLLTDLRSLLSGEKLEELFRSSLRSFVSASAGAYRFCPSPDCPSVYRVSEPGAPGAHFVCGACRSETCTSCHVEYHPFLSCEKYREFKDDPDTSLRDWCEGKANVKACPVCGFTIEKVDGCNHIECLCGRHVCWVCLEYFGSSDDCYSHLRSLHEAI